MPQPFPPEILSLLFVFCIPPVRADGDFADYPLIRLVPLNLASVCQRWRQVACATSELWTTCWLNYSHPEFNVLWLSRTGRRLIDIVGLPIPTTHWYDARDEILSSITPFIQRCRSFSFGWLPPDDPSSGGFSFPNLISCHIPEGGVPSWFFASLSHCSSLRKLDVEDYSPLIIPVLANLFSLHIKYPQQDGRVPIQVILANAPKLHTLELVECSMSESLETASPIFNDVLVDLRLDCSIEDLELFFEKSTLPSLKILHLGGEYFEVSPEDLEDPLTFHAFLERSNCKLETFRICSSYSYLEDALRHTSMSSLRILEISRMYITPEFLDFLIDTTTLPNLRTLRLLSADISDQESFSLLSDLVSARRVRIGGQDRPLGSRLEYFELELGEHFMSDNPRLRHAYAPEARRIRDIARASEGEMDPLVVHLQDWRQD